MLPDLDAAQIGPYTDAVKIGGRRPMGAVKGRETALVTGAASGMGRVIATALRDAGFDGFGPSRRPVPEAAVQMLTLDVRSDASVRAAIDELAARAGRLDVLVNNAAVRFLGAAEETNAEEARAVFE